MALNRYQFIGHIGADAEVRTINDNQRAVISFRVAVTEKWKDAQGNPKENTTWVKCSIWRKPDQTTIAQYLKKGQQVYIEGKPTANAYVDNEGAAKASLEVTVDSVELLGRRPENAGGMPVNNGSPTPQPHQRQQQQATPPIPNQNPLDDDLPF